MSNTENKYTGFNKNCEKLSTLITQGKSVFGRLDMKDWEKNAKELEERIKSEHFKVMVLGDFKRGKSTFVNAFLGSEILPSDPVPCTAIINEIKWGDEKRAILHFKNPLPEVIPEDLAKTAIEHINKHKNGEIPPVEIPVNKIEEYVKIKDPAKPQDESVAESPYEKVEIYWPLQVCSDGVEIIDSPGLNENNIRTKVATEYLSKIDAVIFVISCDSPVGMNEMVTIESDILGAGHEYVFYVFNKFDIVRPKNRESVINYGISKLKNKTKLGEKGIFFLSALDALEGRIEDDEEKVQKSGMPRLEQTLNEFLVNDRGKVKILQPARELSVAIREARDRVVPARYQLLNKDVTELQQSYDQALPRLRDLERKKVQIVDRINYHRENLKDEIKKASIIRLREIVEKVPEWVSEIELENKINFLKLKSPKKQAEAIANEISRKIQDKIGMEQVQWKNSTLSPMIDKEVQKVEEDIGMKVGEFYVELDQIMGEITGTLTAEQMGVKNISPLERVLAVAGGVIIGDPINGAVGGFMGVKHMLANFGIQIGLLTTLFMLGIFNPIVLVPVIIASGIIQVFVGGNLINKKLKAKAGEELARSIKENIYVFSENIADKSVDKINEFSNSVQEGLEKEIQMVHDQVNSALEDLRLGESEVSRKKQLLDGIKAELINIDNSLADLIWNVGMNKGL